MQGKDGLHVLLAEDNYFMHSVYDVAGKKFQYSEGGTFSEKGDSMILLVEFSTLMPHDIGTAAAVRFQYNNAGIIISGPLKITGSWARADDGSGELAGNWRITGRKEGDSLRQMPKRDRKTLKLLTGSRFQWAAINPATKEFFGTGGGTYTFKNGHYTEHIEFFSRDSSRVGATLTFNGEVKNGQWHHSGKSSTGNPIYEIWSREK